jgi:transposase-like protein
MGGGRMDALQQYITQVYQKKWNKPSLTIKELLRIMYVDKKMSMMSIAKELGISPNTVQRWLKKQGISSRKMRWL